MAPLLATFTAAKSDASPRDASDCTGLIAFDLAQVTHPENRARCAPGEPCPSIASTGRAHVAGAGFVRRLTVTECERVMGFPDEWTVAPGGSDTARRKALGNAVVPAVVEWIARRLRDAVFREMGAT